MTLFQYADSLDWTALQRRYRCAGHGQRGMRLRALRAFVAAMLRREVG